MLVLATRDRRWMKECEATLLAVGLPFRWHQREGVALLDVPTSNIEEVSVLLGELLGEELRRKPHKPVSKAPLLLQPAFAVALCLAAALSWFFTVTGPFVRQSDWFDCGALITDAFVQGEWWRLVTAATLHADFAHILGNGVFLVVLGWAAAERVGPGVMLLSWLGMAVFGFVVSLTFSDVHATVGASGGLFGLLGVAAGHGTRAPRDDGDPRKGWIRAFGAALCLLALTAFSRQSNIYAHVGGFVGGGAVGLLLARLRIGWPGQILFASAALAAVVACWELARSTLQTVPKY